MPRRPIDFSRPPAVGRGDGMSSFDSSSALTMRTQQKRVEPTSRLLEADDVAEYLGVRTDWVYREVRAGRLPHIRLGRAVRFRRESIEAWIDSRERGVPARRRL